MEAVNQEEVELSVCAPAYNEAEGIEAVVREWEQVLDEAGVPSEIVITNDGSTDSTGEVLARLQAEFPNLVVVSFERNGGYGRALSAAVARSRGRYVVTLDSDGQFDLAEYRPLLDLLQRENLDVVTGYRHAKQAGLVHVLADRGLNLLVRLLFGLRLRDTNCALKVFRGAVARSILIEAAGYPTPTEYVVKAHTLGYRVGEHRVTHRPRLAGQTKLKVFRTAWQVGLFLVYLKYKQWLYRRRILARF